MYTQATWPQVGKIEAVISKMQASVEPLRQPLRWSPGMDHSVTLGIVRASDGACDLGGRRAEGGSAAAHPVVYESTPVDPDGWAVIVDMGAWDSGGLGFRRLEV